MGNRSAPGTPAARGKGGVALENAVRRLTRQVLDVASDVPPRRDPDRSEVFLDLEVDGMRCLLVRREPPDGRPGPLLSPRELEIARLVAKGHPNKTIAAILDISSWTVSTYLRRVFAKMGVSSRTAMVTRLLQEGLMGDPPPKPPGR